MTISPRTLPASWDSGTSSTTTTAIPLPSDTAVGDLLTVQIESSSSSLTITTLNGWTETIAVPGSSTAALHVLSKTATSADTGGGKTCAVTFSGSSRLAGTAQAWYDTGGGTVSIDGSATSNQGGTVAAGSAITAPASSSPSTPADVVLSFVGVLTTNNGDTPTFTAPTGYTMAGQSTSHATTLKNAASACAYEVLSSNAATGTVAFTADKSVTAYQTATLLLKSSASTTTVHGSATLSASSTLTADASVESSATRSAVVKLGDGATGTTASLSFSPASTWKAGDLVVVALGWTAGTLTPDANFTSAGTQPSVAGLVSAVYTRVLTSGDVATPPTWTFTLGAAAKFIGAAMAVTGLDTSSANGVTAYAQSATATAATSSNAPTTSSLTRTADVYEVNVFRFTAPTTSGPPVGTTVPGGFTGVVRSATNGTTDAQLALDIAARNVTLSSGTPGGDMWSTADGTTTFQDCAQVTVGLAVQTSTTTTVQGSATLKATASMTATGSTNSTIPATKKYATGGQWVVKKQYHASGTSWV